jgi:hypothetical protein
VRIGRQFLYDSRCWADIRAAILALAPLLIDSFRPDLADRNWRRLLPVRRAILHALESRDAARRSSAGPPHIRHRQGETALAWLMSGWAHVAGLTDTHRARREADQIQTAGVLEAPLVDARVDADVLTASLDDGFHLRMTDDRVIVEDPLGPAPFTVAVSREREAEAIAGELGMLTEDTVLHKVLNALVGHFQRG